MIIDDLYWIKLVADATTPPEWAIYDGRIIGVPTISGIGSGKDNPGELIGLTGYPTVVTDPVTTQGFVMTRIDSVTLDYIDGLMSGGWTDPAQLDKVRAVAASLRSIGVAAADVRTALGGIIEATTTDIAAATAAATPVTGGPSVG